jgi:hypothetical protein
MAFIVTREEAFDLLLDYVGEFEADYDLDAVFAELDHTFHLTGPADEPSWKAARTRWNAIPEDRLDAVLNAYDRTLTS